jgi:hypothetical protein
VSPNIHDIRYAQFVENVLGIKLSLDDTCILLEGKMPYHLKQRIKEEQEMYESFLGDIMKKIGQAPTAVVKTFKDASGLLKFIWGVISDASGQNLINGIKKLTVNMANLFTRIKKAILAVKGPLQALLSKVVAWVENMGKKLGAIRSDVSPDDDLKGEQGNWKKFMVLLLVGMVVVFVANIVKRIDKFGGEVVEKGLTQIWNLTQGMVTKLLGEPAEMVKAAGAGFMTALGPLLSLYSAAKVMQAINKDLVSDGSWVQFSDGDVINLEKYL